MKILTTAIMLRFVLNKPLSRIQWLALVVLILGVADVQLQYQPPTDANKVEQRPWIGFCAVFTMCFTSAVAGIASLFDDSCLYALIDFRSLHGKSFKTKYFECLDAKHSIGFVWNSNELLFYFLSRL